MGDDDDPDTPDAPRRRKPKIRGLETLADLKRETAHLYRAGRRGDLSAGDASKLASVLALLARLTEGDDFDQRLAAVEGKLALAAAEARR